MQLQVHGSTVKRISQAPRINITHILSSALATHTVREQTNNGGRSRQRTNGLAVEASRKSHQHKALHYVSLSNVAAIRYCFTINHSLTRSADVVAFINIVRFIKKIPV